MSGVRLSAFPPPGFSLGVVMEEGEEDISDSGAGSSPTVTPPPALPEATTPKNPHGIQAAPEPKHDSPAAETGNTEPVLDEVRHVKAELFGCARLKRRLGQEADVFDEEDLKAVDDHVKVLMERLAVLNKTHPLASRVQVVSHMECILHRRSAVLESEFKSGSLDVNSPLFEVFVQKQLRLHKLKAEVREGLNSVPQAPTNI